jgi:hypothetical protein
MHRPEVGSKIFATKFPFVFNMEGGKYGGAEGDRTPDLGIANAALSQLSYCPLGTKRGM